MLRTGDNQDKDIYCDQDLYFYYIKGFDENLKILVLAIQNFLFII